jgi:Aspartyl protease
MTTFKWSAFLVLAWMALTATIVPALLAESHCPGNVASLPFRLVNRYQIVVAVSINHSGPYDFLLDTGTQITMVDPSVAAELHLNTTGAAVVRSVGFRESASFTQLDLLEAGSHAVANQKVLVYGLLNLRSVDPHIRGILGEDFLEHFDMLIDYAHRLLCFDNSAVMRAEVKGPHITLATPAQTADGAPLPKLLIIAARLSGEPRPVRLMLDSGANIPYLDNTSQHLVPQPMAPTSFGGASLVGIGADGDQHVFSALPPQEVKIGSLELPNVTFLTLAYARKDSHTTEFDGLLTTDLFRRVFISHADHFVVLVPR